MASVRCLAATHLRFSLIEPNLRFGPNSSHKRGTVIENIHLTDDADEIEGRTDKVKGLVLRTEFLKKAWGPTPGPGAMPPP